MLMKTKLIF